MSAKRWPKAPDVPDGEATPSPGAYGGARVDSWAPVPPKTRCKHGAGDCEGCGTTDRRDVEHTTIGGRGAVARLRRRGAS